MNNSLDTVKIELILCKLLSIVNLYFCLYIFYPLYFVFEIFLVYPNLVSSSDSILCPDFPYHTRLWFTRVIMVAALFSIIIFL
jgi:hypothetical protein